jgi:hypothetical protein
MISDDELLLYHYRDGLEPADRARIGAALAADPEVARRLHALVARLDAVAAIPEVPVPEAVQQRWRAALDRHASTATRVTPIVRRKPFAQPRWLAAAAAVAAVALVFVLQRSPDPNTAPVANNPPTSAPEASAYEKGLKEHLATTEQRLVSLSSATPEERAVLIGTILDQNRLYALAAERAGEPQLARVLRAFAPILEDVAAGGAGASETSLAQLNFELRVMQARLAADGSQPSNIL